MTISVRIVNMDHYMAKPGPLDRVYSPFSKKLSKVPVIRIFGSTLAGQKVCLHVHQVYPYFFIHYSIPKEYTTEQEIQKDIFKFGNSLNEAMNLAKPNAEKDQHIVAIVLTKGVPFYGYHVGYQSYLKIYLVNPFEKQQMLDLLQSEAIMDTKFQPHEAHLNFELQFLMDHNLFGMDWLHIDEEQPVAPAVFRLPLLEEPKSSYPISQSSSANISLKPNQSNNNKNDDIRHHPVYTSKTLPEKLQSNRVPRDSYCELELDVTGMSILNRLDLNERSIHTNLVKEKEIQHEALSNPEEEAKKKLVKSLESIWKDETSRRKSRNILEPIPPAAQTEEREPRKPWISEPSFRKLMNKMMTGHEFDQKSETQEPSKLMADVMTVFQSVEALYPEEYYIWKNQLQQHQEQQQQQLQQQQQQQQQQNEVSISQKSDEKEKIDNEVPNSEGSRSLSELRPPSIPDTSRASDTHRSTSPPPSTQNRLVHFNISATPSRYRAWDIATQLDKSIIDTLIRDPSFHEDIDEENEEEQVNTDFTDTEGPSVDDEDDDEKYFNQFGHITEDGARMLMEEGEKHTREKYPTTAIEYSEDPPVSLRPRKLDFLAESEKIDRILQEEGHSILSPSCKKDILDDMADSSTEDSPFDISNVPPDPVPWPLKPRKKRRTINQLDGSKDEKSDQTSKKQKSSANIWEIERERLMRARKKGRVSNPPSASATYSDSNISRRTPTTSVSMKRSISAPSREGLDQTARAKTRKIEKLSSYCSGTSSSYNSKETDNTARKLTSDIEGVSSSLPTKPFNTAINTESKASASTSGSLFKKKENSTTNNFVPPLPVTSASVATNEANKSNLAAPTNHSTHIAAEADNKDASTGLDDCDVFFNSRNSSNSQESHDSQSNFISCINGLWSPTEDRSRRSREQSFFHNPPIPSTPSKEKEEAPSQHRRSISMAANNSKRIIPNLMERNNTQLNAKFEWPLFTSTALSQRPNTNKINTEFMYSSKPPKLDQKDLPKKGVVYRDPFYSKADDLPRFPTVFAGKEFKLPTSGIDSLKEFKSVFRGDNAKRDMMYEHTKIRLWTPNIDPPSLEEVKKWAEDVENMKKKRIKSSVTQLDKPTADNTYNFKVSATKPQAKVRPIRDYIDYFSLEIHVNTRDKLLPDPQKDPVQVIFWCLQTEDKRIISNGYQEGYHVGVISMRNFDISKIGLSSSRASVDYADDEEQLFTILIEKIRYYDPDMLVGYEVQNASWGYLVERGVELGIHLLDELSRVFVTSNSIKRDRWGYEKASVYRVIGRHMLNVWRLMKSEITLTSYTFENIAYHLLHDRVPHYSYETLTSWYTKGPSVLKFRLFKYYLKRVQMNLDMLDASQVVTRTCESARVFGVDFYAVISRGSQYKVESIMFRIAKPENFVLITPNRRQVASQRSLEIIPLIMEPVSQFYSSPMVVLDFQSLYPSIMIAYNYCYSTCLGRVRNLTEPSRFGVKSSFDLKDGLLDSLKDYINVSPNGIMFVKPEIRKSLLAKMLTELLDTRVMIKRAMKDYKDDTGLLRMLDAKQLTLKLLANVTYGYTSASFSGRMPSVEIADSIVATGRETLERAIRLINETEKWGARVVYGDTDSVFIYFPGKTKEEAFILGNEIAETVTKLNPQPVKLKFEKVYHPAVLLAKKRYVGFKYENPSDTEPIFEAKGIETIRRDGTAATQKILESCLKILFRTQDVSELKQFLYRQWTKILSNRIILQDFIIAKEVRMGAYSSRGGPNGAQIAQAKMNEDARAEPQYGERVPYVVVYRGGPKSRLMNRVVRPEELLADNTLRLDAEYYIRKQIIPPLSRIFNLMGVDIESWYDSMPRSVKAEALAMAQSSQHQSKKITRIDQYYACSRCIVCRKVADQDICDDCRKTPRQTTFTLTSRQQQIQDKFRKVLLTCQDCSSVSPLDTMSVKTNQENEQDQYADIPCDSLDCPIFYERHKAKQDVKATSNYNELLDEFSQSLAS